MSALTQSRLKEVLFYDKDTGHFIRLTSPCSGKNIGDVAGGHDAKGYIVLRVDGVRYKAHRLAFFYMTSKWPINHVDHKDGIRDNNKWKNIREATIAENNQNLTKVRVNNTSGYQGVSFSKAMKKWRSQISVGGKITDIGYYETPKQAHDAYAERRKIDHPFNTL